MKYLLDRMIVSLRARSLHLEGAVYSFFHEIHEEIGRDEIEPRCRAIGELMMFDGYIRGGGIESYVSMYGWSAEAAADILQGYKYIKSPKRIAAFERVAAHMAAVSGEEVRRMASRQGFDVEELGAPDAALGEEVAQLYLLDDEEGEAHERAVEYLRRNGLIKIAPTDEAVEKHRDAILAKSETQQRLVRHRAEQGARSKESSERRTAVVEALAKAAGIRIRLDRYSYRQSTGDPPKNGFAYAMLIPFDETLQPQRAPIPLTDEDGVVRQCMSGEEVVYYEEGDRGVLANLKTGDVLAEAPVESGTTDFIPNWKLP